MLHNGVLRFLNSSQFPSSIFCSIWSTQSFLLYRLYDCSLCSNANSSSSVLIEASCFTVGEGTVGESIGGVGAEGGRVQVP